MAVEVKAAHDEALGAYTFHFKYGKYEWDRVKSAIDIIKVLIPASDREYNPVSKEWTVLDSSWPALKQILEKARFSISEDHVIRPEDFHYQFVDSNSTQTKEYLAAQLCALLLCTAEDLKDEAKLKKLYRKKAMEWHPDRNNGDGSMMSELNAIWSQYNA